MNFKIILIMWLALLIHSNTFGKLEGMYYPVLDSFSYNIKEVDDTNGQPSSEVYLNFRKLRSECDFRDINFYITGKDSAGNNINSLMESNFKGTESVRVEGEHTGVGPWVVNASKEDLDNMSIALTHRCHVLYETKTIFGVIDGFLYKR